MIQLAEVAVSRGANRVVEGLTVDIEPGEVFWVVGPNGAGKTSLLRVLAGLDSPRAGVVTRSHPVLLYFHSEMAIPGSATVGGWERLVERLSRGAHRQGAHRQRRTSLWPDVEGSRRVSRLSTGQRKRLLLDALLRQEGPLVLDEPFEHLSPGARSDLAGLLEARASRHEVVVASNQQVAARERGLYLDGGVAAPLRETGARP